VERSNALVAGLAILVILLLPSVALGSTWVVKDGAGHKRGTVRNTHGLSQADVKHKNGSWAGWVWLFDASNGRDYNVYRGRPHTVVGDPLGWVKNGLLHPGSGSTTVMGKVVKANGRWSVYKLVGIGFRKVGSVPGACPRDYAMGAGSLLIWGW